MSKELESMAKVLLVDSNMRSQEAIHWACEQDCIELIATRLGSNILDVVLVKSPDVIVLDADSTNIDVSQLLIKLKSTEWFKAIPVLIFTTSQSEAVKQQYIELGARGVIDSVGDLKDLGQTLTNIISLEVANLCCKKTSEMLKAAHSQMLRFSKEFN